MASLSRLIELCSGRRLRAGSSRGIVLLKARTRQSLVRRFTYEPMATMKGARSARR